MTSDAYEASLNAADQELRRAETAEDVRRAWQKHLGTLGHRTLGRLLLGRSASELLQCHAERAERD